MEYRGGSKRSFIFILEEMEGNGWRRMAKALREFAYEGRGLSHNRGGAYMRPSVAAPLLQIRSYKEALVLLRKPLQSREWNRGGTMVLW